MNKVKLVEIAKTIIDCFKKGNKLLICGNGGSAAEAQHMAGELVGYFNKERQRKPLPAIALTTDTSVITSIGNDISFDFIFSRQIKALGKKGDVLLTISTSGKSSNIKMAQLEAEEIGMKVVELPYNFETERSNKTPLIQEKQLKMIHEICEIIDKAFVFQF